MTQGSGYVRDTAYFSAFVPAQAPSRLFLAALLAGAPAPDPREPFRYLDLCCGDGVTLATLAACYPHARFVGVDFSADALGRARQLSQATGLSNIEWIEADVGSLTIERGGFDFVSLVGAFSWLDDGRRRRVLEQASDGLSRDGLLILHYASKPGAVQTETVHQALQWLAPDDGTGTERMAAALERLRSADLDRFHRSHPLARSHLENLGAAAPAAFAQESLSPGGRAFWQPEVGDLLRDAGLTPLVEADALESIWRPDETPETCRVRQILRDFQLTRLSRLDVCRRAGEPCAGSARRLLRSLDWYAPGPGPGEPAVAPPRFDRLNIEDSEAWSREADRAIALILRSAIHPVIGRPLAAGERCDLSPFNRFALEEGLARPSSLPLASPTLGTQVVLPARHRLQLYAVCGGDAAGLLDSLPLPTREKYAPYLRAEALTAFIARNGDQLAALGLFSDIDGRQPLRPDVSGPRPRDGEPSGKTACVESSGRPLRQTLD